MLEHVDENTIMVVPTFGVTYTGAYEPVLELSDALDKLQEDTGLDVDIHVDGASGAFLAPFCAPEILWDFRVPRVKSISTSGHKFGLAPLGVGWVLWRDAAELPDDLIFHVTYLGGDMPVFQINFSRPAGQVVAQYYNFVRLGRDGYRNVHQACYDTGRFLAEEIVKLGPFELLCDSEPQTGIPSVAWRIREGEDPGYTLYDVADRLRTRGWQVPAYPLTGSVSDVSVQRILVRQGVSRDLGTLLLRGHEGGDRPFRPPPGHGVHDEGGVGGLQPPVARPGWPGRPQVTAGRSAPDRPRPVDAEGPPAQEARLADLGRAVGRPRCGVRVREAGQRPERGFVSRADPGEPAPRPPPHGPVRGRGRAPGRPWRPDTRRARC